MTATSDKALRWGTTYLQACGIESARLDAEVLLAYCLRWERTALYRERGYQLTVAEDARFQEFVRRRGTHEPIAYLTGEREFWSLPFAVRPGVLIPRPETEGVVEAALRYAQQFLHHRSRCRILDIGTGSGNIAVAVATSLAVVEVVGIDISPAALAMAELNARSCQVADRVHYIRGDLLGPLNPRRVRCDLILSNPPYVAAEELPTLPAAVRCYEPHEALDGGRDGLTFYRRLYAEGPQYLADDGIAIVEVGHRQAGDVSRLLVQSQQWELLEIVKDYSGIERVVVAQRSGGERLGMDYIEIEGGVQLHGHVRVSGAKNAALPIMASLLLATGEARVRNVPRVRDVVTFGQVLQALGCKIRTEGAELIVDTTRIDRFEAPYALVKTMRGSFLVLGPLLARYGQARVSLPGGCAIGPRPVNFHLKALQALGAHLELTQGYVNAWADQLHGATIAFPTPTVTGTEHIMMAAVLAEGTTIVENAAREPEVVNLADALTQMGAHVAGAGSSRLVIEGVPRLEPAVLDIIPDRIEGGTFLVAGAMTGGDVTIDNCRPAHLSALLDHLHATGAGAEVGDDWVRIIGTEHARPMHLATAPYPGFPTDMQAQMMALLTRANGRSVISETVFENRYMHAAELGRMGAEIHLEGANAIVMGVPQLHGAPVMATDLRASASLILAGLTATGITTVSRVYHLDRGYEQIEVKLAALGAKIRRLP